MTEAAEPTLEEQLAADRRRGVWMLLVVAVGAFVFFALLWLAQVALFFLTGGLDGMD